MHAVGSVFMNKYAEGQAGKRYYQGNSNIDAIENLCKQAALKLYHLSPNKWHVNVQPVTGAIANLAVYNAILNHGDKILALNLTHGGHLSHVWKLPTGRPVSISSKIFNSKYYGVSPETSLIDYEQLEKLAKDFKPKLIISGGTAYPRQINFKKIAQIAHDNGAYYLADVAHEAGLIAAEAYDSPFPYADFVTMTTRKTLRGPIGAMIFTHTDHAEIIDRSIFPGIQGGPMINSIAGIAVALEEAGTKDFNKYGKQVIKNAQTLASELMDLGFNVVTGGTDTHLVLIDIRNIQPDGLTAATILEAADIIVNKNTIPGDDGTSVWRPSGIRLGTPAITTRGMKEKDMKVIAKLIDKCLRSAIFTPNTKIKDLKSTLAENSDIKSILKEVHTLTSKYPIYKNL